MPDASNPSGCPGSNVIATERARISPLMQTENFGIMETRHLAEPAHKHGTARHYIPNRYVLVCHCNIQPPAPGIRNAYT